MTDSQDRLDAAIRRVAQSEYEDLEAKVLAQGEALRAFAEAFRDLARHVDERLRHLEGHGGFPPPGQVARY
jgi:hypothetical protein